MLAFAEAVARAAVEKTMEKLGDRPVAPRPKWITEKNAADYLDVHPLTLRKMRLAGKGPRHHVIGAGSIRYTPADLDSYVLFGPPKDSQVS